MDKTEYKFTSIYDFIKINENKGFHFFSPSTKRFFQSRIAYDTWTVVGNKGYFITSEQNRGILSGTSYPRMYTIRAGNIDTGNVDKVGEFQEYSTLSKAKTALKNIVKELANV